MLFYQNLSIYYTWKNIKNNKQQKIITTNLEYQLQNGIIDWITRLIIFCIRYSILFWVYFKKHNEKIDNPSIRIHVNQVENRITFKIRTRYYLELFTPWTMKLLGSTENKATEDKNGENVSHFKITEVLLTHCNI